MNILWLSHFVPFPPKGGCFQRSFNLLTRVANAHEVHLVALKHKRDIHPESETKDAWTELGRSCRSVDIVDISETDYRLWVGSNAALAVATAQPLSVRVYRSPLFRQRVRALAATHRFDLIHADTIGLAQYLDELPGVPALITHHGAESFMIRRRIPNERGLLKKAFCVYEWLSLRSYERRHCPRVRGNIVVSNDDACILSAIAPSARFSLVENGVDTAFFTPGPAQSGRRLVFAGRLDQYANRHGMLKFMYEIWPILQARYPDVEIDIIGNAPPETLRRMATDAVRVHGFVTDVRPFFARATVAVCPLWDGGGTRLKVLDALAQGTPLVATAIGCEGLAIVHERDALVAESNAEFVSGIGRLFDDPTLRLRLRSSGRALVEGVYSWDVIAPKLVRLYAEAAVAAASDHVQETVCP